MVFKFSQYNKNIAVVGDEQGHLYLYNYYAPYITDPHQLLSLNSRFQNQFKGAIQEMDIKLNAHNNVIFDATFSAP